MKALHKFAHFKLQASKDSEAVHHSRNESESRLSLHTSKSRRGGCQPRGLLIRLPVEPAEICLPSGGDTGQCYRLVHGRHESEGGSRDGRPEHPAADDGAGHGDLDALPDLVGAVSGEETLHGEVVGAKDWGVDNLVDANLGDECEEFVGVVEVAGNEEEPGDTQRSAPSVLHSTVP